MCTDRKWVLIKQVRDFKAEPGPIGNGEDEERDRESQLSSPNLWCLSIANKPPSNLIPAPCLIRLHPDDYSALLPLPARPIVSFCSHKFNPGVQCALITSIFRLVVVYAPPRAHPFALCCQLCYLKLHAFSFRSLLCWLGSRFTLVFVLQCVCPAPFTRPHKYAVKAQRN